MEGLVARSVVGNEEFLRFDCYRTDEDRQQRYSDHQKDDEGSAGVDVGAHQTHKQTQQKDYCRIQHCVPVTLGKHPHARGHRGV